MPVYDSEKRRKNNTLVAFDFEWLMHENREVPYAYGIYYDGNYKCYLQHENIYKQFIDDMIDTAHEIRDQTSSSSEAKVNILFVAHNMSRADYPVIQKALLDDKRITLTGQCASGMAKISYTYRIEEGLTVTFIDSLNHMQCSLDTFGKNMGLKIEKQHCDHAAIKMDNYKSEIVRQRIDYYLEMDCRVLYDAYMTYRNQLLESYDVDIISESIFTSASLA
jgi:hypothetical protein